MAIKAGSKPGILPPLEWPKEPPIDPGYEVEEITGEDAIFLWNYYLMLQLHEELTKK